MDFRRRLDRWLAERNEGELDVLLDLVQQQPTYRDLCEAEREARPLLAAESFAEARDRVLAWMPGAFFSPSAHAMLAEAARGLGDEIRAANEDALVATSFEIIGRSGDGTSARPWSVLRINDSWDVVNAHGTGVVRQFSQWRGRQLVDCLVTSDGRRFWFALRNNGFKQAAVG